jgi:membrane dipeptidase
MTIIIDAHVDFAWNALTFGRDYTLSASDIRRLEEGTEVPSRNGHTMLGWPEWVRGRVAILFVTLFAAPDRWQEGAWDILCYASPDEAYQHYWNCVEFYRRLVEEHPNKFQLIRKRADLEQVLEHWAMEPTDDRRIGLVLLMEGGDGVRRPTELSEWYSAGVRILGPAWVSTRYSGGEKEPGPLTDDGRVLLNAMADLNMVLDLSHMADEAAREALDRYPGMVIASHTNPRALLPNSTRLDRHICDDYIRIIAEREGVIGIAIYNLFLKDGWVPSDGRDPVAINDIVVQIDHVCQLVGDAEHVGIGSDFDGGFGLSKVPLGLDTVADLGLIGDALTARGFSPTEVEAVLSGNWLRVLRQVLPES